MLSVPCGSPSSYPRSFAPILRAEQDVVHSPGCAVRGMASLQGGRQACALLRAPRPRCTTIRRARGIETRRHESKEARSRASREARNGMPNPSPASSVSGFAAAPGMHAHRGETVTGADVCTANAWRAGGKLGVQPGGANLTGGTS